MNPWDRLEFLEENHALASFHCGLESVDEWLQQKSLSAVRAGQIQVHVCLDSNSDVMAFFAVRHVIVDLSEASKSTQRKSEPGRSEGTGILLAQMGVDQKHQKKGVGRLVVQEVMASAARSHDQSPFGFLVVDAENEGLVPFYENLGFTSVGSDLRMIRTMSSVKKALAALEARANTA